MKAGTSLTVMPVRESFLSAGRLRKIGLTITVFLAPFVLYGLFLLCYEVNPIELYWSMLKSTFGSLFGFGEVLLKATPILLTGLAAALPARAGLINVGGEGQLIIGALFATFAAVFFLDSAPSWVGIPLMLVFGALGGAVWAGIVAVLKTAGRMNETISSLLLNYVATHTVSYFVHGILKDPAAFNWPYSPQISWQLRLPTITGTRLHIGFILAILLAAVVWFILSWTKLGFNIRVLGGNKLAAQRTGFRINWMYVWVLLAAGALAGIAGMIEITGIEGRLRSTTGVNYGYLGFLAAWMAWNHPLRLLFTSFLLGMIAVAGNTLEIGSGLPASSVQILMALVLFFLMGIARRLRS